MGDNYNGPAMADEILKLRARIAESKDEIQALMHDGRQGELERANVGLAEENHALQATL